MKSTVPVRNPAEVIIHSMLLGSKFLFVLLTSAEDVTYAPCYVYYVSCNGLETIRVPQALAMADYLKSSDLTEKRYVNYLESVFENTI